MHLDNSPITVLDACLKRAIPFVAYRLPNTSTVRLLVANEVEPFLFHGQDLFQQTAFLVVPFDNERNNSYLLYPKFDVEVSLLSREQLDWIQSQPQREINLPVNLQKAEKEDYDLAFHKIQGAIQCDKISKAILSRCHFVEGISQFEAPRLFERLCDMQQSTFNYLLYVPDAGLWMGASPELFLRQQANTVETVSLAGTMKFAEKIDWNQKDLIEQDIVSNYILEHLDGFQIKDVQKDGPKTVAAGHVSHLKTIFRFPQEHIRRQLGKFVHALHPTPAVCGYPKDLSKEIILETELHHRGLYAGFLGNIDSSGDFAFYVNIRCMQFFANGVGLYVGGGITDMSDVEAEYNETLLKAESLLKLTIDR